MANMTSWVRYSTTRSLFRVCLVSLCKRQMTSGKFTVRRLTSAEEVRQLIVEKAASLGRRPGALDHESFFAADKTGFFVGELDGQAISSISIVKYSDDYAFGGHFIVDEPYRGRGYGLQTYKAAVATLPEGCNLAADSVEKRECTYERIGLKGAWREQRFDFVASKAALSLSGIQECPTIKIQPASEVAFRDILEYDTSVHAFGRQLFLEKWISATNSRAFVTTDDKGKVVGYAVVRTTLKQGDGWRIGPLFADDSQIARSLYRAVFDKVATEDPTGVVAVDVPFGDLVNPDALQIAKELSDTTPEFLYVRMYTKGVPSGMSLKKIYGLTSLGLG